MKRQVLKLDESLIDYSKSATWNIWRQFGVDLEFKEEKIKITKYYMPQEEQQKLYSLVEKKNKEYRRIKKFVNWEWLDFPNSNPACLKESL